MKQIWVLVITLIIVIGAGIWEICYLQESSRWLLSDIKEVYQVVERKDYETAKKETEDLKETWKEIRKTWALFVDDSQLDEVGEKLVSFVSYIDSKDETEINRSYECLKNSVNDIIDFECLKPENIF